MTWNSPDEVLNVVRATRDLMRQHGVEPKLIAVSVNSYWEIRRLFEHEYGVDEVKRTTKILDKRRSPFSGEFYGISMLVHPAIADGQIVLLQDDTNLYFSLLSILN